MIHGDIMGIETVCCWWGEVMLQHDPAGSKLRLRREYWTGWMDMRSLRRAQFGPMSLSFDSGDSVCHKLQWRELGSRSIAKWIAPGSNAVLNNFIFISNEWSKLRDSLTKTTGQGISIVGFAWIIIINKSYVYSKKYAQIISSNNSSKKHSLKKFPIAFSILEQNAYQNSALNFEYVMNSSPNLYRQHFVDKIFYRNVFNGETLERLESFKEKERMHVQK